jgi:hypothetical protein
MDANKLDSLGKKLADAALTLLVRLYPAVRQASNAELEAACAAMRARSRSVLDELIDDARAAPGVAHFAFQSAALSLAHEGIRVLQEAQK